MTVKASKSSIIGLDVSAAREKADPLYTAHKSGHAIDLTEAAGYHYLISSQPDISDDFRRIYLDRALELDQACQAKRQTDYDAAKIREAKECEQAVVNEQVSVLRSSAAFFTLKQAIVDFNKQVGSKTGALFGQMPSYAKKINDYFHLLATGASKVFESTLIKFIDFTSEYAKRLPAVRAVANAATALLEMVRPLLNQYKHGTVSPN